MSLHVDWRRAGLVLLAALIVPTMVDAAPWGNGGVGSTAGVNGTVNTGASGQLAYYPGNGTMVSGVTAGGDCSFSSPSNFLCTKTNGRTFAASATSDTTNAANITSGTLNAARMPLGLTLAPASGQLPVGNAGGTGYTNQTIGGDVTLSNVGVLTVTKTNGAAFGALATQSTSGLSVLKGNGSGGVANAVSGTDYQPPIAGNTLAAHNFVNSISASGVVSGAQPAFGDIAGTVGSAQFGAGSIPSSALTLPLAGNAVTLGGDITGASNAATAIQFHPSGKTIGTSGSNYSVLSTDSLLIVNNTSGGLFTATLPVMASTVNQMVCFKRYDSNIPAFEVVVNACGMMVRATGKLSAAVGIRRSCTCVLFQREM